MPMYVQCVGCGSHVNEDHAARIFYANGGGRTEWYVHKSRSQNSELDPCHKRAFQKLKGQLPHGFKIENKIYTAEMIEQEKEKKKPEKVKAEQPHVGAEKYTNRQRPVPYYDAPSAPTSGSRHPF